MSNDFAADWQAWHEAHERTMGDPLGFLSITHLHWLDDEPRRLDRAPGTWSVDAQDRVHVVLEADEHLLLDGTDLNPGGGGEHVFEPLAERASLALVWGEAVVEVARRGGALLVRPHHPDHPLVVGYRGTPAYEPDEAYRVVGRFEPYPTPVPTEVGAAVEGLTHVYDAPGEVVFDLGGAEHRLVAFGAGPGRLQLLFTDGTSGVTTYAANRSVVAELAEDGTVVVDFNRAVNLPCAYTDQATCPMPPAGNRLTVAVEAGEKIPHERTADPGSAA